MRRDLIVVLVTMLSMHAFSQENMVILSGGYSFANIEDTDVKGTGWRINGTYEYNPMGGMFSHGVSFGYIHLTATEEAGALSTDFTINSFPLYYAPKVMFGNDRFKAFLKGALGVQFAGLNRTGVIELSDNDFGFYGGGGAGITIFISDKIFVNGEYEIAWASNSWYSDGWMNTAMGGIGFRF